MLQSTYLISIGVQEWLGSGPCPYQDISREINENPSALGDDTRLLLDGSSHTPTAAYGINTSEVYAVSTPYTVQELVEEAAPMYQRARGM